MRESIAVLIVAALSSGCAGVRSLDSFPTPSDSAGAVVFHLIADNDVPYDFLVGQFNVRILDEKQSVAASYHVPLPAPTPAHVDQSVLLELPPGRYSLDLLIGVWRRQMHFLDLPKPKGAFASIEVRPGQAVSLGRLDLKVAVQATSAYKDDSITFTTTGTGLTWDDSPAARREAIETAIADPRARNGERPAQLRAALQALPR